MRKLPVGDQRQAGCSRSGLPFGTCTPRTVLCAVLSTAVLGILPAVSGCSGSSNANRNTISPYDLAFEPEGKEGELGTIVPEAQLLEQATGSYDRGLYSLSREQWTQLREQYPASYYATLAELKIADCYFFAGDYSTAITSYEEFIKLHPAHEAVPYCRFQVANAHREQWSGVRHDPSPLAEAVKHYRILVSEFPESEFAGAARRSLNQAREELSSYEVDVARYYLKQGQYSAARERLESIRSTYPDTVPVSDGTVSGLLTAVGEVSKEPAESGGWFALLDFGRPRTQEDTAELAARLQAEQAAAAAKRSRAKGEKKEEVAVRETVIRERTPSAPAMPKIIVPLPVVASDDIATPNPGDAAVVASARGAVGPVELSPFNRSSLDGPLPPPAKPVLASVRVGAARAPGSYLDQRAALADTNGGANSTSDGVTAPPKLYALTCEVTADGSLLFTARTSQPLRTAQQSERSAEELLFRFASASPTASAAAEESEPANERCDIPGGSLRISGGSQGALDAHLWLEKPGRVRVLHVDRPYRTLLIVLPR